jgi:membrane-associated phospholipid phosphatase
MFDHSVRAGRLRELSALGLAEDVGQGRWRLADTLEPTLRRLGERGDIIRTMQRALAQARLECSPSAQVIHDREPTGPATIVVGRVVARGLADELRDRHYLIVDATDGRSHFVDIGTGDATEPLPGRKYEETVNQVTERLTVTPLSRFLQLQPPPFGTIFDVIAHVTDGIDRGEVNMQRDRINMTRLVIDQGQELARAFENETPGLFHRHALNWLLFNRADISPPRQARIWMALDMAIYTALSAAWYYKWWEPDWSRLLRPSEFARRCAGRPLSVLFDEAVVSNGRETNATPRPPQGPLPDGGDPGTPRHPAWPSGHSTYSAAASHILEFFFSPDTLELSDDQLQLQDPPPKPNFRDPVWIARELRRLAANIGEAQLWAGVHWTSDHFAGQKIGRAAAQAVVAEFMMDGIEPLVPGAPPADPPARAPFDPPNAPARPAPTAGQDTIVPAVPGPAEMQALRNLSPT